MPTGGRGKGEEGVGERVGVESYHIGHDRE